MCKRALSVLLAVTALAVTTAGCVSMPNGGPVLPYAPAPSGNGQAQLNLQFVPHPPLPNAKPEDIVRGFLAAGASFVGQQQVAREYLTPEASRRWQPGWSAAVFRDGPAVYDGTAYDGPAGPGGATDGTSAGAGENLSGRSGPSPAASSSPATSKPVKAGSRVTVLVGGDVQAKLTNSGAYAVASGTPRGQTYRYDLVKQHNGQWRIFDANENPLLLTQTEFQADYQLRNLYFFDPSDQHLVPDPVYVPIGATREDLINGLVKDLITQPPDWLADGATQTAFPKGTIQVGQATIDGGTASVNLGGAITRASYTVKLQVSAQLLSTLSTAGQGTQGVQSVALYIKGKPFIPLGADGNPVQRSPASQYLPLNGGSGSDFYYIDSRGELLRQFGLGSKPAPVSHIGTGYNSLAVSSDGLYLAVLRAGTVYVGTTSTGKLTPRANAGGLTGFTSLSWDSSDTLWAAGPDNVVMVPATTKPSAAPVSVDVRSKYQDETCGSTFTDVKALRVAPVKALRVAPDGVRVALVLGGQQPTLAFGAIVVQDASGTGQLPKVWISLSPFFVCDSASSFGSLSWYGGDSVIAVGQDGETLTRYPVNGGTPTTISGQAGIQWITARYRAGLIASAHGRMFLSAPPFTGAWSLLGSGTTPAYPGS